MKKPDNLEQFNARMEAACEGTAWEWAPGYWSEVEIIPRVRFTEEAKGQKYVDDGPFVYAPAIYFNECPFGTDEWRFEIQIEPAGVLRCSKIDEYAAALMTASALVKKLTAIVAEYYE